MKCFYPKVNKEFRELSKVVCLTNLVTNNEVVTSALLEKIPSFVWCLKLKIYEF